MRPGKLVLGALSLAAGALALRVALKEPSNARDWKPDVARMPKAEFEGDILTLHNVRNTRYGAPGTPYEVVWETRRYDLRTLKRLWFIVEPFHPTFKVIAHTFLSFEFEDDFLALSIEARIKQGESYSIFRGLVNEFELFYGVGDERDLLLRRTLYLGHDLYLYPLVTPPHEVRTVLEGMLQTANALRRHPRFYNSITNNCTSALRKHANRVRPGSFPAFVLADVLPGLSDRVLFDKGWIDTGVPGDALRETHSVGARVAVCAHDPDFSTCLRRGLGR